VSIIVPAAATSDMPWRRSVRAIVLDEEDRILLCRFVFPHPAVPGEAKGVWAAPGGASNPARTQPIHLGL
jgi:hypothetical protein